MPQQLFSRMGCVEGRRSLPQLGQTTCWVPGLSRVCYSLCVEGSTDASWCSNIFFWPPRPPTGNGVATREVARWDREGWDQLPRGNSGSRDDPHTVRRRKRRKKKARPHQHVALLLCLWRGGLVVSLPVTVQNWKDEYTKRGVHTFAASKLVWQPLVFDCA